MTDRAKKISELLVTTSVANTDKLIVLKDPSGTPLTRSVTVNTVASSIVTNYISDNYVHNDATAGTGDIYINGTDRANNSQGGTLVFKAGSSNTGTGGFVEIWSGNGASGADITLKTWSGSEWLSWSFTNDGKIYYPDGTWQNTAHNPSPSVHVMDSVYIATLTDEIIICDPNAAGANIAISLPVTSVANGKTFSVKNINTGANKVTVALANGAQLLENPGAAGALANAVNLTASGNCCTWAYCSGAYRLLSYM